MAKWMQVLAGTMLALWVTSGVAAAQSALTGAAAAASPVVTPSPAGADAASPTGAAPAAANAQPIVRIKDIARFKGVRDNQLVGMGLVVGLDGTGDRTGAEANIQMVAGMLQRFGITVDTKSLRLSNVAAVMVTATLPPFAQPGGTIDATVSSFGNARSLQGGLLLQTPLKGADGAVYAVAQGAVSIGGFNVRAGGVGVQQNHPVVGTVPNGAIVEQAVPVTLAEGDALTLVLQSSDLTTASRVAASIDKAFGAGVAEAVDGSSIAVHIPAAYQGRTVDFAAQLQQLEVQPDEAAKVVINERTGTVVMGSRVRIAAVAVSHGNLTVRVDQTTQVSQPPPFSGGNTVTTTKTQVNVQENSGHLIVLDAAPDVGQLVKALNAVGATPRDMIAILEAIKDAGALYGTLEIV